MQRVHFYKAEYLLLIANVIESNVQKFSVTYRSIPCIECKYSAIQVQILNLNCYEIIDSSRELYYQLFKTNTTTYT